MHGRLGVICIVHLDGDPNTLFPLPVLYVSPSNVPDPTILAVAAEDIGPLKDYTLTGYKEHRGRDGYGFNATLRKDCKPIAEVLNEGSGGCNFYRGDRTAINEFVTLCKDLCPTSNMNITFEQEDNFIDWLALHRPQGTTWAAFVQDWNQSFPAEEAPVHSECADCGSTGHDTESNTCPGPDGQDKLKDPDASVTAETRNQS